MFLKPLPTLLILLSACAPGLPSVAGVAGTPAGPGARWVPPARDTAEVPEPGPPLPPDVAERIQRLTLADIVDLGLRNNPATRISWANARAAAALYGAEKGGDFPTLDLNLTATRLKTVASQGRSAVQQTVYGPSLTLSYLLFDFGGRTGAIEGARSALLQADWTHDAVIQDVVLEIESAYFTYLSTRALRSAQETTLREAETNLTAAEERHKAGVATVADLLQARTARSQARLAYESTEGALQTARGALAISMGLPANLPYDLETNPDTLPVAAVADSVEALIAQAVRERPDLAAAEAQVAQFRAGVKEARSEWLPALTLNGNAGRTYLSNRPGGGDNYSLTLGLQIPLFSGFSPQYRQKAAEAQLEAASARAQSLRQQVVFQVFSAYYNLQTATRRVRSADDLLASASESEAAALARYKAGVGGLLDLLAAQSALADARAQQVQARWIWSTALAQLAHDTGLLDIHGQSPLRLTTEPIDTTGTIPR